MVILNKIGEKRVWFFSLEKAVSGKTFTSPCLKKGEGEEAGLFWVTQRFLHIV